MANYEENHHHHGESRYIRIRVSGKLYETRESTLSVYPQTLLGNKLTRRRYYDRKCNEYKFNHHCQHSFDAILFYYQSRGILARPSSVKRNRFIEELEFFQIDHCLDTRYLNEMEYVTKKLKDSSVPDSKLKEYIWRTIRFKYGNPIVDKVLYCFYVAMVTISVLLICFESYDPIVVVETFRKEFGFPITSTQIEHFCLRLELTLCVLFVLDLIANFYVDGDRLSFIFSSAGSVDLGCVVTSLAYLTILHNYTEHELLIRITKCARVVRVMKYTRISRGVKQVIRVLYACGNHVLVFVGSALMACFLFSALIHIFEEKKDGKKHEHDEHDVSFLDMCWFAVITATGVGYGDIYPRSPGGKICGAALSILGVILFCLPTTQLVYKFVELYYLPVIFGSEDDSKRKSLIIRTREGFFADMETFARRH